MLKGISPVISPKLIKILMEMGHGDEIVIADRNFPAASVAQRACPLLMGWMSHLCWKPFCRFFRLTSTLKNLWH